MNYKERQSVAKTEKENELLHIVVKRKHIHFLIAILALSLLVIPFTINSIFKFHSWNWLSAEWSAGDFLSFYGTVLSFLGTMALSALALYQNHLYQTEARRLEKRQVAPVFSMESTGWSGNYAELGIKLINTSDNAAKEIEFLNCSFSSTNSAQKVDVVQRVATLIGGATATMNLGNRGISNLEKINAQMRCADRYGEWHIYSIVGHPDERTIYFSINEVNTNP